jgi:hypothetical protein
MKTGGYWEYDNKIVYSLSLEDQFKIQHKEYNGDVRKAMTAVIVDYL